MTPREFAIQVARKLQTAGYEGLWAGGCVRDQIMDREPKDYDVATNARPEEVRELFGKRRTIAIGAAFGVITVIGPKSTGNIEVATFRRDADYSDGRHPDSVEFTDAREDALRRDFTINGIFYDPVAEKVIDYVEGRADIDCRIIRAIGNPHERIDEDKLRMLRAVRFAATFEFELDTETKNAVKQHASEITVVSPERIGAEMRRMLAHRNRSIAASLLHECGLLEHILDGGEQLPKNRANWKTRLRWMKQLGDDGTFEQAASILLSMLIKVDGIEPIVDRWKLSNQEAKTIEWIETHLLSLTRAHQLPWSTVQPLLIQEQAKIALAVAEIQFGAHHEGVQYCQRKLSLEKELLDPTPLLGGNDLFKLGLRSGPIFSTILKAVRRAQLDGEIETVEQAVELAKVVANDGDPIQ